MTAEQLEVFFDALSPDRKVLFYVGQARALAVAIFLIGESVPGIPDCFGGECCERTIEAWRLYVADLIQICREHTEEIVRISKAIESFGPSLLKLLN